LWLLRVFPSLARENSKRNQKLTEGRTTEPKCRVLEKKIDKCLKELEQENTKNRI
jgi:hypothetical protein